MPQYIALSKIVTKKAPAWSGGSSFQNEFWKNFSNSISYDTRKQELSAKKSTLNMKDKFFEIEIDKRGKRNPISKSNIPQKIREETGLEIVKKNDNMLILHWEEKQIDDLFSVIQSASYSSAKRDSSSRKTILDREIFTIQSINNLTIEKRVSSEILKLSDEIECDSIIEIYSKYKFQSWQTTFNKIKNFVESKGGEVMSFTGMDSDIIPNISIRINLPKRDIVEMAEMIPEIQYIYEVPEITPQRAINSSLNLQINKNSIETDLIVWLFDQWVADTLGFWVAITEKLVENTNNEHGTEVASKILFGKQLNRKNMPTAGVLTLTPIVKILNIQILNSEGGVDDINHFYEQINQIITKYSTVYIYNFSIGFPQERRDWFIHMITTILDILAHKYDKIFIISAGNSDIYQSLISENNESYIDALRYVNQDRFHIEVKAPWDSINGITVGSIVEVADQTTIAKNIGEISPVSRIWKIRCWRELRKPDLVEFWSNHKYCDIATENDDKDYWTLVLNAEGLLKWVSGTSFSAPIITNICAKMLDFFEKTQLHDERLDGNRLNLIKWLLLHKTSLQNEDIIREDIENMFYGYGQPWDIESILEDTVDSFTFIHLDKVELHNQTIDKIHTIPFQILGVDPEKELTICVTLCYNPPVHKDFPSEYSQIVMKSSIKINDESISTRKYKYRHKEDQSPIKTFCFSYSKRTRNDTISIRLQTIVSESFLKRMSSSTYEQHYALFVSVIDPKGDINIRELMLQQESVFEVIQPIQVSVSVKS